MRKNLLLCVFIMSDTVLGQLPPRKIAPLPNPKTNPNSNPNPNQGHFSLGALVRIPSDTYL